MFQLCHEQEKLEWNSVVMMDDGDGLRRWIYGDRIVRNNCRNGIKLIFWSALVRQFRKLHPCIWACTDEYTILYIMKKWSGNPVICECGTASGYGYEATPQWEANGFQLEEKAEGISQKWSRLVQCLNSPWPTCFILDIWTTKYPINRSVL